MKPPASVQDFLRMPKHEQDKMMEGIRQHAYCVRRNWMLVGCMVGYLLGYWVH